MSAPKRITWVAVKGEDVAMVVDEEEQAEYARILRLRREPATQAEVDAWRFPSLDEGES